MTGFRITVTPEPQPLQLPDQFHQARLLHHPLPMQVDEMLARGAVRMMNPKRIPPDPRPTDIQVIRRATDVDHPCPAPFRTQRHHDSFGVAEGTSNRAVSDSRPGPGAIGHRNSVASGLAAGSPNNTPNLSV